MEDRIAANREGSDCGDCMEWLSGWLRDGIAPEYMRPPRDGEGDGFRGKNPLRYFAEDTHKPNKRTIGDLWGLFDRCIFWGREKPLRWAKDTLWAYNGRYFSQVRDTAFVTELVRETLARLGVNRTYRCDCAEKIARPLLSRLRVEPECEYRPDRRWIVFNNGVLDLEKSEGKNRFTERFSMDYCTDIVLDIDFNPRASGLLWRTKLGQIIPSPGFQGDFQQFCGSVIADREKYRNEYICYIHGGGGNGKSVLVNAVASVFGERYFSTFTMEQIFARETASQFVASELDGKLLNICDDTADRDLGMSALKNFISGGKIQSRGVGKNRFYKITPPLLLCCINDFPDIADDSDGYHRRQLIIETTRDKWEGERRDTQLQAKLTTPEMRSAIFNWIYEGFLMFRKNGGAIKLSRDAVETREIRRETSSPMRYWARESGYVAAVPVERDPRWRRLGDLYEEYRAFCRKTGNRIDASDRKVGAMLRSMGCEYKAGRGNRTLYCVGVLGVDTDADGLLLDPAKNSVEKNKESNNKR